MHELSITKKLVEMLKETCLEEGIKEPGRAYLELGRMTGFRKDPIQFYFESFRKEEPMLAGMKLDIEEKDTEIKCNACNRESIIEDLCMIFCPHCDSNDVDIIAGKDFKIKNIE
ncbi:MAG: hydrogenase maturation nickel metallochaperone HypA [Nanobdellota archaeon]